METAALYQIKQYLDMALMPNCLQRLKVLQYKPPQGQSQTATTQTIVQMFQEANMFDVTPEEVFIIFLLTTIQDKTIEPYQY